MTDAIVPNETTEHVSTRRRLALSALAVLGGAGLIDACAADMEGSTGEAVDVAGAEQALTGTTGIRWVNKMIGTSADQGLVNITGSANEIAILTGYAAPADGGGGVFVWSTALAKHDYGTVINPYVGGNPNPNPAAGWRRLFSGSLDVRWFGAVGNGSTNDLPAINNAIAVAATTGIAVYFPACAPGKSYLCNGSITVPGSQGIRFRGEGNQSSSPNIGQSCITFSSGGFVVKTGTDEAQWRDLVVTVGGSAGPAFTIDSSYLLFDNVIIANNNPNVSAVQCGQDVAGGTGENCIEVTFHRVRFVGVYAQPGLALYGGHVNNVRISECLFNVASNATAPCIRIKSQTVNPITNIRIENCVFEAPIAGAVHFYGVWESQIVNCWTGDVVGSPTKPLVMLDTAGSGTAVTKMILIDGLEGPIGTSTVPTIDFAGNVAGQGGVTILNSRLAYVTNRGGNPFVAINCFINDSLGAIQNGFDTQANCNASSVNLPGVRIQVGTAPPTTQTWNRGDRILNTQPSAGGVDGWVCVSGGTPGTWKAYGTIAS